MTTRPFKGSYTALIGGLLVAAILGVATSAGAHDKVAVCHRTGSEHNPYVQIEIAQQGWDNGHSKHEGDFLVDASHPCPPRADRDDGDGDDSATPTPGTTPSPTPQTLGVSAPPVASSWSYTPEPRLPAAAPMTGGPPQ